MSATRAQIRQSIARSARLSALIARDEGLGDALVGGFAGATLQKPGTEPKWNLVLPKGKWFGPNFKRLGGSIDVTDAMVAEIVANWTDAGKPRLPIRWGHEHLNNTDPAKQAFLDRKAGNLLELRAGAHGLEALTAWNELGAKDIDSGAFDAWSPEWYPTHASRTTDETKGWWLSGVALTGDPYFHLMPPVAASVVEAPTDSTLNKEHRMSLVRIAALFGLAATASEDAIFAAAEENKKKLTSAEEKITVLTAKAITPDNSVLTAALKPMQDQLAVLTAANVKKDEQLTALTAANIDLAVDGQVATSKRGDGKNGRTITEKQIARAKQIAKSEGLTASAEFLNEFPLTVPIKATGVEGSTEPLTASAAQKVLQAKVEELKKDGNISPYLSAIARNPELARTAQGEK